MFTVSTQMFKSLLGDYIKYLRSPLYILHSYFSLHTHHKSYSLTHLLILKMYFTWTTPLRGSYKLDVHTISASRQSNGNYNSIGVVIRDHLRRSIKGLTILCVAFPFWRPSSGPFTWEYMLLTVETGNYAAYYEVTRKDVRGDRTRL